MSEKPKLPAPAAYRCEWDDGAGWRQYHDKSDPLPTEWDSDPPDWTVALYTADQVDAAIEAAWLSSRRQALEEAAAIAEAATARTRRVRAMCNTEPIKPCAIAAAIRREAEGK